MRQPPRQRCHGITDEQHGPVGVIAAAKSHTRNVPYQRAQTLLARLELLLHRSALGQVADEPHKHRFAIQRYASNRNANGHGIAVGAQGQHLAAVGADHATALALQVALQVGVMARAIRLGHEHGHVLAHHLIGAPPQDAFGRRIEGLHPALRINHHHAIHGRVGNRAQAGLALAHLQEHLPVAQASVDGDDQYTNNQGHGSHRQGHGSALCSSQQLQLVWHLDKAQRRHPGVVHARNGQPHDHARCQVQPAGPPANHPLQSKSHPQGHNGQQHGHQDGGRKAPRIKAHEWSPLGRLHADVMHGANASADEHAADDQGCTADFAAHQQPQRNPRRSHARKHRQRCHPGIKTPAPTHCERQHADKVHRPDAPTQRHRPRPPRHLAHETGVCTPGQARHL